MMKKVSLTLFSYPSVDAFLASFAWDPTMGVLAIALRITCGNLPVERVDVLVFVIASLRHCCPTSMSGRKHIEVLEMTTRGCPKKKPREMILWAVSPLSTFSYPLLDKARHPNLTYPVSSTRGQIRTQKTRSIIILFKEKHKTFSIIERL